MESSMGTLAFFRVQDPLKDLKDGYAMIFV